VASRLPAYESCDVVGRDRTQSRLSGISLLGQQAAVASVVHIAVAASAAATGQSPRLQVV
jgi:hypothetical protein